MRRVAEALFSLSDVEQHTDLRGPGSNARATIDSESCHPGEQASTGITEGTLATVLLVVQVDPDGPLLLRAQAYLLERPELDGGVR
jgi:hypothetical protein